MDVDWRNHDGRVLRLMNCQYSQSHVSPYKSGNAQSKTLSALVELTLPPDLANVNSSSAAELRGSGRTAHRNRGSIQPWGGPASELESEATII